jgi:hypothetical protein
MLPPACYGPVGLLEKHLNRRPYFFPVPAHFVTRAVTQVVTQGQQIGLGWETARVTEMTLHKRM